VLHTFATTQSAMMKKRVARYMVGTVCPVCDGKRLKRAALSVTFAGMDIGALSRLSLAATAGGGGPLRCTCERCNAQPRRRPQGRTAARGEGRAAARWQQ
jgi:excinuclease ABC subunit A